MQPMKRSAFKNRGNGLKRGGRIKVKSDPKMAAWSKAVRERDGNKCQFPQGCLTGDKRIDPHHIAKRSQRPDLKYDVRNGICLCRTHHQWTDKMPETAKSLGLLSTESYELAARMVNQ